MKKFFTLVQWWVVLLLVAGVAWSYLRPKPQPAYTPETWSSWKGFMAISYAGIARSASETYPSPGGLLEHLQALRNAGYEPIRPEDAAAFLAGRHPLPERALLIFFEGGRKDSLIRATPALQRTGFIGTMAVPTMYFDQWGSAYLKRPDLRAAARWPHWAFASMGHHALDSVRVDTTNKKGRFLTQRQWMGTHAETDDEFKKRITGDYYVSQDAIEAATLQNVLTYIYPYSDSGTGPNADPLAAEINRAAVSMRYSLAFVGGDDPFNGPDADPFCLSRLRVSGLWDGQRLVQELQQFEPNERPVASFADRTRWFIQDKAILQNQHLRLGDGGAVWLRGSEAWTDLECVFRAVPDAGARVSVYLRYSGPGSYVRLTVGDGTLRVQERLLSRLLGLATLKLSDEMAGSELRMVVRGRRAWVYAGERKLLGPLPLSRETANGRVGIGCEDGAALVTAFAARPNPAYVAVEAHYSGLVPEVQHVVQTLISPWFQQQTTLRVDPRQHQEVLQAAANGVTVVPLIGITSDLSPDEAALQAASLAQMLNDAALSSLISEVAVRGAAPNFSEAVRGVGLRVLHILGPDEARALPRMPTRLRAFSKDRFLLDVDGDEAKSILDLWLRHVPASRLIVWRKTFAGNVPYGVKIAISPNESMTEEQL